MFRYNYDEVEGDTTTPELEFLPPTVSRCVKVLKFVGDNKKMFIFAGLIFLMFIGMLVVVLVLEGHGGFKNNSVEHNHIGENQVETKGNHHREKHKVHKEPEVPWAKAESRPQSATTTASQVNCIRRRRVPENPVEISAISLLFQVENEKRPEFDYARCKGGKPDVFFRATVTVPCGNHTFGPAFGKTKERSKPDSPSAKELAARLAVAALYNVTYTTKASSSSAFTLTATTECKPI